MKIEEGICLSTLNPSWQRPFRIVERKEKGTMVFFRCAFTEKENSPCSSGSRFMEFGIVHERESGITEGWPIIDLSPAYANPQMKANNRAFLNARRDIVTYGEIEMKRHLCKHCNRYVVHQEIHTRTGCELAKVTYICPLCGHIEEDMID